MKAIGMMQRLRAEVGLLGIVSLALIAAGIGFEVGVLRPLEARRDSLEQRIVHSAARDRGAPSDAAPGAGLQRFYRYFESRADAPPHLARLHLLGKAAGLDLRSAQYRVDRTGPRIVRYEIELPLTGSYSQIRSFVTNALAEIPVLSLDQISMKKDRPGDAPIVADVRMTLHLLQP